jgi:hypothetical protein
MTQPTGMHCRAPGCSSVVFCKAHIVPRGFARLLSSPGGHNRAIHGTGADYAKQTLGDYDLGILCGPCDSKLGPYDDCAIDLCRSIPSTHRGRPGSIFAHEPFDGATFARAILAILWRASLSTRPSWDQVDLGPYLDPTGRILYEGADLATMPEFQLVLGRYVSRDHDAKRFIFYPLRIRNEHFNAYAFGLCGFQVIAKFDKRPMPPPFADLVVNEATSLRAYLVALEDTAEYTTFRTSAALERARRAERRR